MKILLIGIDGLDWIKLKELIESGKANNIRNIFENGHYNFLKCDPALSSPSKWTSVVTGLSQEKHKIIKEEFYFVPQLMTFRKWPFKRYFKLVKVSPYLSNMRKGKAIWNLISENNKSVGVIGWWCTYPAEKVNGFVISPYNYAFNQIPLYKPNDKFYTYPESLYNRIKQFAISTNELRSEELNRLRINVPIGSTWYLARDLSFANISSYMMKNWDIPDLLMIFFEGLKSITGRYIAAKRKGFYESEEEWEAALDQHYLFIDKIVGDLWKSLPQGDGVVMIVSTPYLNNETTYISYQTSSLLMLFGKNITKIHNNNFASILDVTPTILALLGSPLSDEIEGKILYKSSCEK